MTVDKCPGKQEHVEITLGRKALDILQLKLEVILLYIGLS